MYEYITALESHFTEDDAKAMAEAEQLLDHLEYYDHQLPIKNLMGLIDLEDGDKAIQLYRHYYDAIDTVIMMFGIKLVRDGIEQPILRFATEILGALTALDDPENIDVIEEGMSIESDDPNYIFSHIVSLMTIYEPMAIYTQIESVDAALLNLLKIKSRSPELTAEAMAETKVIRANFIAFQDTQKLVKTMPVYTVLKQAESLPISLALAVKKIEPELKELILPKDKALNIYALLVAANVAYEDRLLKAITVREDVYGEEGRDIDARLETIHKQEKPDANDG